MAWSGKAQHAAIVVNGESTSEGAHNEILIKSIVRAHAWVQYLRDRAYDSIEQLAEELRLHPKVVRQNLRLAFLSPGVTSAILEGSQPATLSLTQIPKLLPLSWNEHRPLLADQRKSYLSHWSREVSAR